MSHQTTQKKKGEKSKSISFLHSKVNQSPPRAFLDVCGASCVYATRAAAPAAKRRDSPQSRSALSQQSRRRCPADLSRVCGEESRRGGEIQYTSAAGSGLYLGKSNGTVCYQKKTTAMERKTIWMYRVECQRVAKQRLKLHVMKQRDPAALSYNAKYEIHNRIFDTSAVL